MKLLDMGPPAQADMQAECREQVMEKFKQSGLLNQELSKSERFQRVWKKGTECSSLIPGGTKEHTAALSAFYHADQDFKEKLDTEVEDMGLNVSIDGNHFHFKSLYFLLMDSLMLLKPKECKTVYAILDDHQKLQKQGSTVRFSTFFTADLLVSNLPEIDGVRLLKIYSCLFVNFGDNVCGKNIGEVLLSPAEYFTVEGVSPKQGADDVEYTEVVLKHSGMNSVHECSMFSR